MHSALCRKAIALAKKGFYVFPITPKSKFPPLVAFKTKATRNEETIQQFWRRWPDANIGIYTGKYKGGKALVVVDIDMKNGKNGESSLKQFEANGFEFPETITVRTPTGGRHLIYVVDKAIGQRPLSNDIDVRSAGGYVVAPGSIVEAGEYQWT